MYYLFSLEFVHLKTGLFLLKYHWVFGYLEGKHLSGPSVILIHAIYTVTALCCAASEMLSISW